MKITEEDKFTKGLERIRASFLEKLEGWIPAYEQFLDNLIAEQVSDEAWQEFESKSHQLAGSAKTFGFPKLNDLAAQLELLIEKVMEKPNKPDFKKLKSATEAFLKEAKNNVKDRPKVEKREPLLKKQATQYRILIADDDVLVSELIQHGFEDEPYEVTAVQSGDEVLEFCKKTIPNLILLDINMPQLSGFETLKSLKASKKTEDIPVVLVTKDDQDKSVIKGISYGAIDYIVKPFEPADVVARIKKTLQAQKQKILIVDDDYIVRDLLEYRFAHTGFQVITAETGKEAIAKIKSEKPSIVLLDMMLPMMDGLAVLKQVKSVAETANIPIVFLTAKSQKDQVLIGIEHGAEDYITKPFNVDEVLGRVNAILQRKQKS